MTVSARLTVAVNVPDVPVMMTLEVPAVAVLLAVKVSTLFPVVGLVLNTAPTPLGSPDAANVTLPANPPASITVTVSVMAEPCVTDNAAAAAASVKLGVCTVLTVSETAELAVRAPDVPVIVSVEVPVAAALPAVRVNTLEPVVGLVPNEAVTPAGRPLMLRVTALLKPLIDDTVTLSVAVVPCSTVTPGAATVKPAAVLAGIGGKAFCTSVWNSVVQKVPAGGEFGIAPVNILLARALLWAGSQFGSPVVEVTPLNTLPG